MEKIKRDYKGRFSLITNHKTILTLAIEMKIDDKIVDRERINET